MKHLKYSLLLTLSLNSTVMAMDRGEDHVSASAAASGGGAAGGAAAAAAGGAAAVVAPWCSHSLAMNEQLILKDIQDRDARHELDQEEVNGALGTAARNGHQTIVAYLLNPASPLTVRPSQGTVRNALTVAASWGHQTIIAYLLNPASPLAVRPDKPWRVNTALMLASRYDNQTIVAYLLNPASPLAVRPNQEGVGEALDEAILKGHQVLVAYLLNPESPLTVRPDQETIFNTYNAITPRVDRQDMRALLEPHIPLEHRLPPLPAEHRLPAVAGGAGAAAVGQEAMYAELETMRGAYQTLATDSRSSTIIDAHLPAPEATNAAFTTASEDVNKTLTEMLLKLKLNEDTRFQIQMAQRTLMLLNGDASIERHGISGLESYQYRNYPGMPNIRQLFVLAYNLLKPKSLDDFVKGWLAEKLSNPADWRAWSAGFREDPRFSKVAAQANVGLALSEDASLGNPLITLIAESIVGDGKDMTPDMAKRIIPMKKSYFSNAKDSLMPLIEALFMVMRGHNTRLLDPREANKPACADGAYLNILKAITQTPDIADVAASKLAGLEITHCGALPAAASGGGAGGAAAAGGAGRPS